MRRLSELAAETGAATTLIHHQSKTKQADPFDAVAGSFAMSAGADGRMVVEKLPDTERLVRVDGRVPIHLRSRRGSAPLPAYRRAGRGALGAIASDRRQAPCNALYTEGSRRGIRVTDRQARRILTQREHIGAVEEFERGRYLLTEHIVEAAARIQGKAAN